MLFGIQTSFFPISVLLAACAAAPHVDKLQTETCKAGFNLCPAPTVSGSSGAGSAGFSGGFSPYTYTGPSTLDFITSIGSSVSAAASKRALQKREGTLCCNKVLECRVLTDYSLYICYDNGTSDYYLVDGSNGNADTGMFYDANDESNMNLLTGDYVYPNGTRGNVYDNSDLPRPTATAPTPEATGNVASQKNYADPESSSATPTASFTSSSSTTPTSGSSSTANSGPVSSASTYRYISDIVFVTFISASVGGLLLL
ncbi:hypothetical protein PVAG01_10747 [Phlyctema vagabunda]|uniref:Uncharacterized protein n=1 Tax=Phlyctema vagabunda TaxID=108571 RepID=A0ABR4P347_9HELO